MPASSLNLCTMTCLQYKWSGAIFGSVQTPFGYSLLELQKNANGRPSEFTSEYQNVSTIMALLSVASDSRNGDYKMPEICKCERYANARGFTNWGQLVRSHTRFLKCKFHLALNHCSCVYANAHTLLVPTGLHIDWLDPFWSSKETISLIWHSASSTIDVKTS